VKDAEPNDCRESTLFTEKDGSGCLQYRSSRPALLVSSTSWTGRLISLRSSTLSLNLEKVEHSVDFYCGKVTSTACLRKCHVHEVNLTTLTSALVSE